MFAVLLPLQKVPLRPAQEMIYFDFMAPYQYNNILLNYKEFYQYNGRQAQSRGMKTGVLKGVFKR